MGSTQIRSRDNGPKERPFSLVYVGAALRTTTPPARREISQRQKDAPGADVLGSVITLPKVKPDADLDADEADTDEGLGVNEAEKRLVGVAAEAQKGSARGASGPTLEERALRRGRKETV
ncbi:hypothetical protein B0H13DRAFT_1886135 [Mycena leptocephala]|nr:hypothetical protein B0H13DRAFT_1886135 [Mycena leptocephala]